MDYQRKVCLSRPCQQRAERRHAIRERVADTICALNEGAGFKDPAAWPQTASNPAQEATLQRIHQIFRERPPAPEAQSDEAALRQLLKEGAGYSATPGELASYDENKIFSQRATGAGRHLSRS